MEALPAVGVVGCGYWGKNLINIFSELGALRVVCVSTPNELLRWRQNMTWIPARRIAICWRAGRASGRNRRSRGGTLRFGQESDAGRKECVCRKAAGIERRRRRTAGRSLGYHGTDPYGWAPAALPPGDS